MSEPAIQVSAEGRASQHGEPEENDLGGLSTRRRQVQRSDPDRPLLRHANCLMTCWRARTADWAAVGGTALAGQGKQIGAIGRRGPSWGWPAGGGMDAVPVEGELASHDCGPFGAMTAVRETACRFPE